MWINYYYCWFMFVIAQLSSCRGSGIEIVANKSTNTKILGRRMNCYLKICFWFNKSSIYASWQSWTASIELTVKYQKVDGTLSQITTGWSSVDWDVNTGQFLPPPLEGQMSQQSNRWEHTGRQGGSQAGENRDQTTDIASGDVGMMGNDSC